MTTDPTPTTINEPPTTTVPAERGDSIPLVGTCPDGLLPQSYAPNARCEATDPCIVTNPATGEGSTLWYVQPCQVAVDQPVDPGFGRYTPGELPATGVDPLAGLIVGLSVIAAGLTCWLAARPSLRYRREVER